MDWPEAEAVAVAEGGHLVTINDAEEGEWLVSTFTPLVTDQVWMGFEDIGLDGRWEWVSGEGGFWESGNPAGTSYTNWRSGEPGGSEPYGLLFIFVYPPQWADHHAVAPPSGFRGIIEIP